MTAREAASRGGRVEEPPRGTEPHGGTGGRLSGRRGHHGSEAVAEDHGGQVWPAPYLGPTQNLV
jgi:hypothetical protein